MAAVTFAIAPSMYSFGCMDGFLAFLAPKSDCRLDIMMRCGSAKRNDQLSAV